MNKSAILSIEEVRIIREKLDSGVPAPALARAYGVNAETIRRIGRRETWAWLDRPTKEDVPLPPITQEVQQAADESAKRLLAQLDGELPSTEET